MKLKTLTAVGAALTVLAAPAAAEAHKKPTVNSVRAHVKSANKALDKVTNLIGAGDQATAAIQLAENRLHTNAASREAAKVRRSARGSRGANQALSAYRLVAQQQNRNVEAYAALVGSAQGRLQEQTAKLLSTGLQGREQALSILTALLEKLPEPARAPTAAVVQALSADGLDELTALFGALAGGTAFPPNVQDQLGSALDLATEAMNSGLLRLNELVGLLPPQAQAPVQQAIGQVEQTIGVVTDLLEGLLGSATLPGADGTAAIPDVGSLLPGLEGVLPGLGGVLPDLTGLLGGIVPSTGGGGDGGGATDPVSGLVEGLLGGLLGGLGG